MCCLHHPKPTTAPCFTPTLLQRTTPACSGRMLISPVRRAEPMLTRRDTAVLPLVLVHTQRVMKPLRKGNIRTQRVMTPTPTAIIRMLKAVFIRIPNLIMLTPTNLTIGGGAGGTPVLPVVRSNSTYGFEVKIVGRDISGVDHLWAIRRGLIHNEAGTIALAGSIGPASPADIGTTGGLSWSVAITADATNNAIQVQVTGAASTTIHWSCSLQTVEVG